MVKWFDSNYHYVRPTLQDDQKFTLVSDPKPVREFLEAKDAGILTRPVLVGPVSFLHLGKPDRGASVDPISLLQNLLPAYVDLLIKLKEAGAEAVQIDEPVLVLDLPEKTKEAFGPAYHRFASLGEKIPKLIVATYFGDIVHNISVLPSLSNVAGIHLDLVRAPQQLSEVISSLAPGQVLSAGVVDGRNIWKTDFQKAIGIIQKAVQTLGEERVIVATSSSLLHTPHSLESEKNLPTDVSNWFSFATEKVKEVAIIAKAVTSGPAAVKSELENNIAAMQSRATSARTNDPAVKDRQSRVSNQMYERKSPFPTRITSQQEILKLPLFPTTTIGSFPQTKEIRVARQKFTKNEISAEEYEQFINREIELVIKEQDAL